MQLKCLLLSGIRAPFDAPESEIIRIAKAKMKRARIRPAGLHFRLYKKSFDARRKNAILQVCSVVAESEEPIPLCADVAQREGIRAFSEATPTVERGTAPLGARPLVVGMGPAGLFAALLHQLKKSEVGHRGNYDGVIV